MEFVLPDVFQAQETHLYRAKDAFLKHYELLEKQRLLHAIVLEFKSNPALQEIWLLVSDKSFGLEVELKYSDDFDTEDWTNRYDVQSTQCELHAVFVPELADFCRNRTVTRSMLFDEAGLLRAASYDRLLREIED